MAVYEETINLVDGVSGPAKAATSSLAKLMRGLAGARGLAGVVSGGPLAKAVGGGGAVAKAAKGASSPMPQGKLSFGDDSGVKAATGITKSLGAARVAAAKSAAMGDTAGYAKATANVEKYSQALAVLPAPAKKAGASIQQMLAGAAHAAEVGASTIGAAVSGIGSAFGALSKGDVKGAIAGITDSIAGMAKLLDLVVPGLGQMVGTVVSIAGGIVGIGADLTVGAMKFAVSMSEARRAAIGAFDALGEGKISGAQVVSMLGNMSNRLGIAQSSLEPLAKGFMEMGVVGEAALQKLTEAAISAEALVGQGGAAAFTALEKKVQGMAQMGGAMKLDSKFIRSLSSAGLSVDDLAASLGTTSSKLNGATVDANKLGGALADAAIKKGRGPLGLLASSWENVSKKLHESIGRLFGGLDGVVGPFMEQVRSLFSIFEAGDATLKITGTSSGAALKAGIGGALTSIFGVATKVIPMIKSFLLNVEIYALKAYIQLKPIGDALLKMGGASSFVDLITGAFKTLGGWLQKAANFFGPILEKVLKFAQSATGLKLIATVVNVLGAAFKLVGGVLLVVVGLGLGLLAWTVAAAITMGVLIGKVWDFGSSISDAIGSGVDWAKKKLTDFVMYILSSFYSLKDMLSTAGSDMIDGLIGGITSKLGAAKDAVADVGKGVVSSIKSIWDSHSPSKVAAGIGAFFGTGLADGLSAKAPDVHGAATEMAGVAVAGASAAASPGAASSAAAAAPASGGAAAAAASGASGGVVFEAGSIVINGADKSLEELTLEVAADVFEQMAIHAGLA